MNPHRRIFYIINGITVYRILAAPVLLILILLGEVTTFKWMLALSFFTDAIDGYLARRYKVLSVLGARLDSIGDDLTVTMAVIGIFKFNYAFLAGQWLWIIILLALFLLQTGLALYRYGKMTAFHTYIAKFAAVLQALFLVTFFFSPSPLYILFYSCAVVTAAGLLEEIVLIFLLPVYTLNVKGLYWVLKEKNNNSVL